MRRPSCNNERLRSNAGIVQEEESIHAERVRKEARTLRITATVLGALSIFMVYFVFTVDIDALEETINNLVSTAVFVLGVVAAAFHVLTEPIPDASVPANSSIVQGILRRPSYIDMEESLPVGSSHGKSARRPSRIQIRRRSHAQVRRKSHNLLHGSRHRRIGENAEEGLGVVSCHGPSPKKVHRRRPRFRPMRRKSL